MYLNRNYLQYVKEARTTEALWSQWFTGVSFLSFSFLLNIHISQHAFSCSLHYARLGTAHGRWLSSPKVAQNSWHWRAHINDDVIMIPSNLQAVLGHRRRSGEGRMACLLRTVVIGFFRYFFFPNSAIQSDFFSLHCFHHHCRTASLQGQKWKKKKRLGDIGWFFTRNNTQRHDTIYCRSKDKELCTTRQAAGYVHCV